MDVSNNQKDLERAPGEIDPAMYEGLLTGGWEGLRKRWRESQSKSWSEEEMQALHDGILTVGWRKNSEDLWKYLNRSAVEEKERLHSWRPDFGLFSVMMSMVCLSRISQSYQNTVEGKWLTLLMIATGIGCLMAVLAHSITLPAKVNFAARLYVVAISMALLLAPLGWLVYQLAT